MTVSNTQLKAWRMAAATARAEAYAVAVERLIAKGSISPDLAARLRLVDIDDDALAAAREWPYDNRIADLEGHWDWDTLYRKYASHYLGVPIALWYDARLSALTVGRISKGRLVLRVNVIQSHPTDNTLPGLRAEILLTAAEAYAARVGVSQVILDSPLKEVIPHYEALGYTHVKRKRIFGNNYMWIDVK